MPAASTTRRRTGPTPVALRLALALALPFIAALTVAGTYIGKEVLVAAAWVAFALLGTLLVNPVIGVVGMSGMFLLAAYPTLLQSLGFLTLNNLLGLGLLVLLVARILETRDLSFLKNPQVLLLVAIGFVFMAATYHADVVFPLLQASRGKKFILDRTADMGHDFLARLVFLVFFLVFVRSRRDVGALFLTFMLALFLAVPSALVNWMQGTLNRGFRAAASLTAGANPNRLAMICLMEVACWWYWSQARSGLLRRLVAYGAIAGSMLTLLATGSRSGLLGCGALALALQTGPKRFRVPASQIALGLAAAVLLVVTVIPAADWQRMIAFFPDPHTVGASSSAMREDTIWTGSRMVRDHPVLGIGLGNFREVSRQIYGDQFYRPPHNSFLWAASEGGLVVFTLYMVILWVTWKDLSVVTRLVHRDLSMAYIASALRVVFILYCFFSAFADLFLNPITYILIGSIVTMRRYVESLPETQVMPVVRRPAATGAAAA
jgi:hypothetical protein